MAVARGIVAFARSIVAVARGVVAFARSIVAAARGVVAFARGIVALARCTVIALAEAAPGLRLRTGACFPRPSTLLVPAPT